MTAGPAGAQHLPVAAEQVDPRRWRALAVLALVQMLIVIDNTIVNVALPSVQRDLHFSTDGLAWVVNGYMLAAGGLLLLGGRLGDLLGHRSLFLAGAGLFGLASLGSGLAVDRQMLLISRFAQGGGEALAAPAGLALIALLFPGTERAKALGVWGGLGGLGSIVGVLLSGVLVEWGGWRWIFLINIPFVLAALVLAPRLVSRTGDVRQHGRLDLGGAVLITAGLGLLVEALLHLAGHPLDDSGTLVPLGAAVVCLIAFVLLEQRVGQPLAPLPFFRNRTRVTTNAVSAVMTGVMAGMFLLLTLYQQQVLGYSPIRTGLAYLPFCLAFAPGFGLSALLMSRLGTRAAMVAAFLCSAVGMLLLTRVSVTGDYLRQLLPAMLPLAVGLGMGFPAVQHAAMVATTRLTAGLASGVQTAVQALGGALGVATFVTMASRVAGSRPATHAAAVSGYRVAFLVGAGAFVVVAALSAVLLEPLRPGDPAIRPEPEIR